MKAQKLQNSKMKQRIYTSNLKNDLDDIIELATGYCSSK